MEEEKSVKEILKEISQKLDSSNVKKKKFWMPFGARVGKIKAKKGWVTVLEVKDNRNVVFHKFPIDEQTIMVDGVPRLATPDETLYYKGKPMIILPSWSVKPFSPSDNYEETIKQSYASQGYKLLLNRMMGEVIKTKRAISGWVIFIVIAIIAALGYFAYQGGLFK